MRERFGARSVMMDTLRAASVLGAPGGLGGGGVAAGASLAIKQPARVATTGNITLSGLQTIDGVTVAAGDRVLVRAQTNPAQNGIYVAASGAWARDTDFDEDADVRSGVLVPVSEGNLYAGVIFQLDTDDPIVVGTTAITFTEPYAPLTVAPAANVSTVGSAGASIESARGDHVHAHGLSYLPDAHHAQSHVLATIGGLGSDHTVSGLTAGQYLRATGATTAAFQAIPDGDLPATIVRTSRQVIAGNGLTGGGTLSADVTLHVGAGTLISVAADSVSLANGSAQYQVPVTGASPFAPAYTALSAFAGNGLVFNPALGGFAVGVGNGLMVNADDVALQQPGTLSVSTTNNPAGNHTHAITASAAPGTASALLKTDANGGLALSSSVGTPFTASTTASGFGGVRGIADVTNGTGVYGSGNAAGGAGVYGFVGANGDANSVAGYFLNQGAGWGLWVDDGPSRFDADNVYIGDTANSFMSLGLTINQGANDNEILALKSSDVAHGFTGQVETDTWGDVLKVAPADGGLQLRGFRDAGVASLFLVGAGAAGTTAKTTAAAGEVIISAAKLSGTTFGDLGADENIVVFRNNATTRFIFDAEGSAHADVEWLTFDEHDDVAVLSSLEHSMLTWQRSPAMREFRGFLRKHAANLERLGIIHFDREAPGHAMVNFTRLSMLLVGAVRQLAGRVALIESRLLPSGA